MSFFKQLFPEQRVIAPEASPKLRGLKGFSPQDTQGLQDPFYADDPVFWILTSNLGAGGAGNAGHVGVELPDQRDIVVIVDGALIGGGAADSYNVDVLQGDAAVRVALATDSQVFMRNRRLQTANTGIATRTGLIRITDNTNNLVGQNTIATGSYPLGTMLYQPLGHRLFRTEQLFIRNNTLNVGLVVTMWGRQTSSRG